MRRSLRIEVLVCWTSKRRLRRVVVQEWRINTHCEDHSKNRQNILLCTERAMSHSMHVEKHVHTKLYKDMPETTVVENMEWLLTEQRYLSAKRHINLLVSKRLNFKDASR